MNAAPKPAAPDLWHKPPAPGQAPVEGYDGWLRADLGQGQAELDAGKAAPLEDVRKEFGLE